MAKKKAKGTKKTEQKAYMLISVYGDAIDFVSRTKKEAQKEASRLVMEDECRHVHIAKLELTVHRPPMAVVEKFTHLSPDEQ